MGLLDSSLVNTLIISVIIVSIFFIITGSIMALVYYFFDLNLLTWFISGIIILLVFIFCIALILWYISLNKPPKRISFIYEPVE